VSTPVGQAAVGAAAAKFLAAPRKMLIGGAWVDAIAGGTIGTAARVPIRASSRSTMAARVPAEPRLWPSRRPRETQ